MMRGLADEASDPKYAHIERERRWRVIVDARPDLSKHFHILIEDHYITGTRMRLRRMTDSKSGEHSMKLTKKYEAADPLARAIVTTYLTEAEYDLLATLPAKELSKRRFHVLCGGIEYSLDQFFGHLSGLELVEIEWPDDEGLRQVVSPKWAAYEVSTDIRYQGGSLVESGVPLD